MTLPSYGSDDKPKYEALACGLSFELEGEGYVLKGKGKCQATDIVIPSEYRGLPVMGIGSRAFWGCSSLKSVFIPDSVMSIGEYAFFECKSLKSIIIPDSVMTICANAFYRCSALTTVKIGKGVKTIKDDAFKVCSSLTDVYIDDLTLWCAIDFEKPTSNPLYYAENLYVENKLVKDLLIPNTVKSIGVYAFYNCLSLRSLIIPSSVTSICECAFFGCTSLKTVSIPSSVTTVRAYAFYGCKSLACVYATDLSAWCEIEFENQSSNPLNYGADMYLDNQCLTELSFPGSFTLIRPYLFCGCKSLKKIIIEKGVSSVEDFAFFKCSSLTSVEIPRSVTSIGSDAFNSCTSLKSVAIPDSVTVIGDNAFFNCKSLKTVTIGEAVLSLGISAFGGCTSVGKLIFNASEMHDLPFKNNVFCDFAGATAGMTLTIGPSVTRIPAYLFYPCEETSSVPKISNVVFEKDSQCASIGESAFGYCTTIKKVYYSGDRDDWDRMVFGLHNNTLQYMARLYLYSKNKPFSEGDFWHYDKKGIPVEWERLTASKTVEPDNLFVTLSGTQKTEESYSLNDESAFVTLRAADASEDDGDKFSEWLNFKKEGDHYRVEGMGDCEDTDISIPPEHNGMPVTSIRGFAFYDCPGITSVTIPGSVTSIGESAFSKCTNLISAFIPFSVKSIDSEAFNECESLMLVRIPSSVISLGDFVFACCSSLMALTIPPSLSSIPAGTFDYCGLLSAVTIPKTVKSIGDYAFNGCESLKDVFYSGSQSDWKKISIGKDNDYLKNATIHLNCNKQS
ncbi:MAG: leucine-rich repeat domain-containing protein [Bacteroidales bacterium]|nr:leucine-rich repeat domain-containing protein [Bacteroidales bacterium]